MGLAVPRVSVLIPVFNGERHIQETLRSAQAADYPNCEILILDDGSTDRSQELIARIADKHVRVLSNSTNQGLVAARRRLMDEADGSLLAWLDQDDVMFKRRLSVQSDFLMAHHDIVACGTYVRIHHHSRGGRHQFRVRRVPTKHRDVKAHLPFGNPINFSTSMMHRGRLQTTGLSFRSEFGNTLDYDLWARLADESNLANVPQVLGQYRVHEHQTSSGPSAGIMLQQARLVQQQTIGRNFGLEIGSSMEHIHFKMTMDRPSIVSLSDLEALSDWVHELLAANRRCQNYFEANLQRALARQWFGALKNFVASGADATGIFGIARAYRSSGLSNLYLFESLYSWFYQSLVR